MLKQLIDFGFAEEESAAALVATNSRNVEVAIDRILAVRENPSLAASVTSDPPPVAPPAASPQVKLFTSRCPRRDAHAGIRDLR
jgi:uncharacterized UBP type Zn finger protein